MARPTLTWGAPDPRRVAQARHRHQRAQRFPLHAATPRKPPSQTWRTFLDNHFDSLASSTSSPCRQQPSACSSSSSSSFTTADAWSTSTSPSIWRRLDRPADHRSVPRGHAPGICDARTATASTRLLLSPGRGHGRRAGAYRAAKSLAESLCGTPCGSVRRECLNHVIVLGERICVGSSRATLAYYHGARTHLSLARTRPGEGRSTHRAWVRSWNCPKSAVCTIGYPRSCLTIVRTPRSSGHKGRTLSRTQLRRFLSSNERFLRPLRSPQRRSRRETTVLTRPDVSWRGQGPPGCWAGQSP